MRLARYILGVIAAAHIAGAQAQKATPFPAVAEEPFPEDTTEIEDCLAPFDALHLDAKAKGELVRTLDQSNMVQSGRCRLVINYEAAQARVINYMRENQERCRFRREYREAVNATHSATKKLMMKLCKVRLALPAPAENYFP